MNTSKFELVAAMMSLLACGACTEVETQVGSNAAGHTSRSGAGGAVGKGGTSSAALGGSVSATGGTAAATGGTAAATGGTAAATGGTATGGAAAATGGTAAATGGSIATAGSSAMGGAPGTGGGPACTNGMEYFFPGCGSGDHVEITPGCYQPCGGASDGPCPEGKSCQQTVIDPCVCSDPSKGCCDACGMGQNLCLPEPPKHCSNESTDPRILSAESWFGMCTFECDYKLSISAGTSLVGCDVARLDVLSWPSTLTRTNRGLLSAAAHEKVRALASGLSNVNLLESYGCPDCADGGASKLSLIRAGVTSSHTYQYAQPPAELQAADAFVQSIIRALNVCQSNANVIVTPECVPRTSLP